MCRGGTWKGFSRKGGETSFPGQVDAAEKKRNKLTQTAIEIKNSLKTQVPEGILDARAAEHRFRDKWTPQRRNGTN